MWEEVNWRQIFEFVVGEVEVPQMNVIAEKVDVRQIPAKNVEKKLFLCLVVWKVVFIRMIFTSSKMNI